MKHFIYYIVTLLLSVPFLTLGMERSTPAPRGRITAIKRVDRVKLADGSTIEATLSGGRLTFIKTMPDGSLAKGFSISSIPVGTPFIIESMVETSDNKILLTARGGAGYFFIVRLNSDGTLDESFGQRGIKTIPFADVEEAEVVR